MVGRRNQADFFGSNGFSNGHANGGDKKLSQNGDIDLGRPRPRVFQFQDAVDVAVEDQRRDELKQKLLEGVDRKAWERFRKSKDEVSSWRTTPCEGVEGTNGIISSNRSAIRR